MYSSRIIEANVARLEANLGITLSRHTPAEVDMWTAHLAKLWDAKEERTTRQLKAEEAAFIRNEALLSQVDFHYWASRYAFFIGDQGGLVRFTPWESQEIILRDIATLEEQSHDAAARGEPVDGILIACHKARQLGATTLARMLLMHRVTTSPHTRGVTGSVDDDKIEALALRDKRILDNLPWWLRPSMGYDVKGKHRYFDRLDATLQYQDYKQMSGLGQGEQYEVGHMTEVASCPYVGVFEHHYFPTIPQSPRALHILESTAQGRNDWWHRFTKKVRAGHTRRWHFRFIPWYAESTKYRAQPPTDWQPNEVSLLHAQRVHDTSPEFMGHTVMLTREQLYWWETTRREYQSGNLLSTFLTNFCATVEESFQHTHESAFPADLLEVFRSRCVTPRAYEVRV